MRDICLVKSSMLCKCWATLRSKTHFFVNAFKTIYTTKFKLIIMHLWNKIYICAVQLSLLNTLRVKFTLTYKRQTVLCQNLIFSKRQFFSQFYGFKCIPFTVQFTFSILVWSRFNLKYPRLLLKPNMCNYVLKLLKYNLILSKTGLSKFQGI